MSRRQILSAGLAAAMLVPAPGRAAGMREVRLVAAPAQASLVGQGSPETAVWAYEGRVPGAEIRARQGERLRVVVENRLPRRRKRGKG